MTGLLSELTQNIIIIGCLFRLHNLHFEIKFVLIGVLIFPLTIMIRISQSIVGG